MCIFCYVLLTMFEVAPRTMSTADDGTSDTLLRSFAMIIFSEIGDKTFLIAAILAMRHPRLYVFAGAFSSLLLMSLLSAEMGHLLPNLVPKQWIHLSAGALFLVFGSKMMMEAREMQGGSQKMEEEMREAAEEIESDAAEMGTMGSNGHSIPLERLEEGEATAAAAHPRKATKSSIADGARNFGNLILGPVFVQSFLLTFLGEWGDRSQIATIALGATHVGVSQLGVTGSRNSSLFKECLSRDIRNGRWSHSLHEPSCHSRSVCLDQGIRQARFVFEYYISHLLSDASNLTAVTFGGATLFLIFGVIYLFEAFAGSAEELSIPIASDQVTAM